MLQWIATAISHLSARGGSASGGRKTAVLAGVILTVVFSLVGFVSMPMTAFAQAGATPPAAAPPAGGSAGATVQAGLQVVEQPLGLASTDIRVIIGRIVRVLLGLLGLILVILILYAGVLWMTAGGNEEQIVNAKKIIKNATIGLIIILSAYAIVLFVMRMLGIGTGTDGSANGDLLSQNTQSFIGSGALGGIIKDHYPNRDQSDVARNTKIILTFRKPIKISSFVTNSNGSKDAAGQDIFGDCINIGPAMNWKNDCDALILDEKHILIQRSDTKTPISGAAVLANYQNGKAYTVVIRPYDYLGDSTTKVPYTVHLGPEMRLDDEANNNPTIFDARTLGKPYYEWQFTCSTELDTNPPVVKSVFPAAGATEVKNTVIQLDFTEALDPTGIQGDFASSGANYYALSGNTIWLKSDHSSVPVGSFQLTNGYRTLEFTSTKECGKNACGGSLYCLPVCDKAGATCDRDQYSMLLKAAQTFTATSFEAIPFSGLMDAAGNALDGNKNGKIEAAPVAGDVFVDQSKPDNFYWNFVITSQIDLTPPYLAKITPGIDAEYVAPDNDWTMLFSKRMRVDPMYNIGLEQYPNNFAPLCRVPRVDFNDDGSTFTKMSHCPFAKNINQYYAPLLNSNIEDVHFNCFYPGKGPGGAEEVRKRLKSSAVCGEDGKNCCAVSGVVAGKSYCCNGMVVQGITTEAQCITHLKNISKP